MIVSLGILQFVIKIHLSEFAGKSLLKFIIILIDERNKNWKSCVKKINVYNSEDEDTYIRNKGRFGGKYVKGDTLIN